MLRPSFYGQAPEPPAVPPAASKDRYRGVDPERLDRLSGAIDRQMVEMSGLFRGDKPVRGRKVAELLMLARALQLHVGTFVDEVELAL